MSPTNMSHTNMTHTNMTHTSMSHTNMLGTSNESVYYRQPYDPCQSPEVPGYKVPNACPQFVQSLNLDGQRNIFGTSIDV